METRCIAPDSQCRRKTIDFHLRRGGQPAARLDYPHAARDFKLRPPPRCARAFREQPTEEPPARRFLMTYTPLLLQLFPHGQGTTGTDIAPCISRQRPPQRLEIFHSDCRGIKARSIRRQKILSIATVRRSLGRGFATFYSISFTTSFA